MKALQDELKSLRQLLEKHQQQKPVGFDPSSSQFPFWQPGQFPFSGPVHSDTAHGNSVPPGQEESPPPTHENSIAPNHMEHAPSTHGRSSEHSQGESMTEVTDSSSICTATTTTGSHNDDHHFTTAATSESSSARPHPPTSKVAMDTTAQQVDKQPNSTNNVNDKAVSKHRPKRKTNKMPLHKSNKERKKISSPSPELQHSDQSDSTISSLSSSFASTLSMFDSEKLSPAQLSGFQGDDLVDTETMRVPSTANLSTWVCPLCGGRSVIINSSGTRQHCHQEPEKVKKQSKSTQCDRASHRHVGQSTRKRAQPKKTEKDDCNKPHYIPNVKNSGLHYSSDVSSDRSSGLCKNRDMVDTNSNSSLHHDGEVVSNRSDLHHDGNVIGNRSSGLHRNDKALSDRSSALHKNRDMVDNNSNSSLHHDVSNRRNSLHRVGDVVSNRSSGLHRNGDAFSDRSSGLHRNANAFSNGSSGLHHGYTPPVQDSGLHYSSDTPALRSSSLRYRNKTPGIRSSILNYNSDTSVVRSTGTQYNTRNTSHRKPRNLHICKGDSVTFAHPKATSTPVIVHAHDYYSSDSSDVCSSPTLVRQPTDYVVVESRPHHRRYHVRPHVVRRCHDHGSRYITTSSDEGDEIYYPATIR